MKKLILLILFIIMTGCKTMQCLPQIEYKDSIRTEYKLDSVYLYERDSIYVEKGRDTVYKEVWKWRYKDKTVIQIDTLYIDREVVQTETVKYIPEFYKNCTWLFWILLILIVGITAMKIYIKIQSGGLF